MHVLRICLGIEAVADGLAINSDELLGQIWATGFNKVHEAAIELLRLDSRKYPSKGVITRCPIGKLEELT